METILRILAMIAMLPSFLGFPIVVITAIIGFVKKDFTYFKKFLKIWGISLLILIVVMVLWVISQTAFNL